MIKKRYIFPVILIGALLVAVLGINFILSQRLTEIIKKTAIPEIEKTLAVEVGLQNASVNLFKGTVNIAGIEVHNPDGFDEATLLMCKKCTLDIGLSALAERTIEVSEVTLHGAHVTLVHNKEGDLNTERIQKSAKKAQKIKTKKAKKEKRRIKKAQPPETEEDNKDTDKKETTKEKSKTPKELPRVLLKSAKADLLFEYINHKLSEEPLTIALDLSLDAANITVGEIPDSDWGTIDIHGNLADNPDAFTTDIKAKIAPVTNVESPDFDIDINISSIDLSGMTTLTEVIGISSDAIKISGHVKCRGGAFDRSASPISLVAHNVKTTGWLAKKYGGSYEISELPFRVNVGGTIEEPGIGDWEAILLKAVIEVISHDGAKFVNKNLDDIVDKNVDKEKIKEALGVEDEETEQLIEAGKDLIKGLFSK